jgi:hypothetical protein
MKQAIIDYSTPRFESGRVIATPAALQALGHDIELAAMLMVRHRAGDWGDVDSEDWSLNNQSVNRKSRILSVYKLVGQGTVWVLTEADRSATTYLVPSDY